MSLNAVRLGRLMTTATAVLLVAACSPGTNTAAPTTSSSAPSSSSAPTTRATPATSVAPIFARCATTSLRVALGSGNGAAGHLYVPLTFTNTGVTCTITGFPGVSYVGGADAHQIGDAAVREPVETPTLLLRTGESASTWVNQVNVDAYDPAMCGPVPATGLRVYPPNNTASVVLPEPGARACANHMVGQQHLTVRAVQAGVEPN